MQQKLMQALDQKLNPQKQTQQKELAGEASQFNQLLTALNRNLAAIGGNKSLI